MSFVQTTNKEYEKKLYVIILCKKNTSILFQIDAASLIGAHFEKGGYARALLSEQKKTLIFFKGGVFFLFLAPEGPFRNPFANPAGKI